MSPRKGRQSIPDYRPPPPFTRTQVTERVACGIHFPVALDYTKRAAGLSEKVLEGKLPLETFISKLRFGPAMAEAVRERYLRVQRFASRVRALCDLWSDDARPLTGWDRQEMLQVTAAQTPARKHAVRRPHRTTHTAPTTNA